MNPPAIPDHTLFRRIGRGAYGEVWLARNVMGTLRAVKIIWRRQFESDRPYEREFAGIQRYEPVSRSADGLVHVLHVGRNDPEGYFYYVMELADAAAPKVISDSVISNQLPESFPRAVPPGTGSLNTESLIADYSPRTLRSDLKRIGRLPTADCLRISSDVASGLAQLHRRGLVHRDVKPGNIIYVNGRAKLADIGLVAVRGEGRTFVGTEGYIPPEGPGTPAADLYALGIALYEASTGYSPEEFPDAPPEWFATEARSDALELHEIILKACEGQRERRYDSAEAMQADLTLLQSGQSVRHVRVLERRVARFRIIGAAALVAMVLALGAVLFANYRARVEAKNRARELVLRQRAELAEHEARQQLNIALYEQAQALVLSKELGHRARALEAIRRSAGATNAAELRRVAFAALGLPDLRLERALTLPARLTLAQPDPKLDRIALGKGSQPVTICSLSDLHVLATLPASTNNDAFVARWSTDGRFLAVKRQHSDDGSRSDLEVWNVDRSQLVVSARGDVAYNSFSFHPQRPLLMIGHARGRVDIWDLESGVKRRDFRLPNTPHALAWSPDGGRFAASYMQNSNWALAFHNATNDAVVVAAEGLEPIELIAWHPRGQWVSVVGIGVTEWRQGVWLIASDSGATTLLGRHKIKTAMAAFSPDGEYLMSCGWDRELFCWDLQTQQRVFTLTGARFGLDWNAAQGRCAIPLTGDRLGFYTFERPACLELIGHTGEGLRPGAFSPDGSLLAIPDSQSLCVWNLRSGNLCARLTHSVPCEPFFSPDGSELFAVAGPIGAARLAGWRIVPGADAPSLVALPIRVPLGLSGAGLASNDLVLTSAEGVRAVARANLASGEGRVEKISPGKGIVSPDGRWLAVTYSYSPVVTVYGLPEMNQAASLETSSLVGAIFFSPAGDELTVINRSGVEWWETGSWRLRRRQPGSPVSGSYALYTPDATGLWLVTNFRETALYDRRTLEPVLPLPPNVLPLALSADGRQLAVSVDDRRAQVWDMTALRERFGELGLDWGK